MTAKGVRSASDFSLSNPASAWLQDGGCIGFRAVAELLQRRLLQFLDYFGRNVQQKAAATISKSDRMFCKRPVKRLSAGEGSEH